MRALRDRWASFWRLGAGWCEAGLDIARWRRLWAVWQIRRQRADYYAFLALRLQDAGGVTLRQLFEQDARRYGAGHPRGVLSADWAERSQVEGGAIARLWHGVFPEWELRVLQLGQHAGAPGLAQALHELAQVLGLLRALQRALTQTLAAALVALLVVALMMAAIPLWSAPRLAALFAAAPDAYRGRASQRLFALADGLVVSGPWLLLVVGALLCLVPLTFSLVRGRARRYLDLLAPWRLQRDVAAVRWLALLQILLQPRSGVVLTLREQLDFFWEASPPWLQWHLLQMQQVLSAGRPVCEIFATGLFDTHWRWLLDDMVALHGLADGLARVRTRLETNMQAQLLARARFWRWAVLIGAAVLALLLLGWHYVVIDELRSALLLSSVAGDW